MSDTLDTVPEDLEEVKESEEQEPEVKPEELAGNIWDLIKKFELEDEDAHRVFFNEAIIGEHYWSNRQYVYLESLKNGQTEVTVSEDDQSTRYTANEYRPNGESIIAAMAVNPPQVNFYPDDAEISDDIVTANAYQRIAELIQKHNDAINLVSRILYILYNQHFVAVYNYAKESYKFGSYQKETYEQVDEQIHTQVCPTCGRDVEDLSGPPFNCPDCKTSFDTPEIIPEFRSVQRLTGKTEEPKSRVCFHAFGNTHVKVAPWAMKQEDTPYLILKFEQHPSKGKFQFSEFKDLLGKGQTTPTSDYEREYRSALYRGEYDHLDTWTLVWFRPSVYNLFDEELNEYLTKNYPNGLKCVFVNSTLVDIENEELDDCWTLIDNPLTTYVHGEPLGKAGIPLQDATNELLNLSMDTITHGIPQTFAASDVLDLKQYAVSEVAPGKVWPVKAIPSGQSLQNYIHTTRTATLSQEVEGVRNALRQMSQLATGAFPSIYGGNIQGSRTASEYAQSRAQALQRLSITWNMVKTLWAKMMAKACRQYANELLQKNYDEKDVKKDGNSYINVWIKRAELTGKVGKVEPEVDEGLPTSWAQQRDLMTRLIELNNPLINEVIADPNNSTVVKGVLGFKDMKIPGYDSRLKQLDEIQRILNADSDAELSSVEIDPILDDHMIEAETCKAFLIGQVGQSLKITDRPKYDIIHEHYIGHIQQMMQMQMQVQQGQPEMNQQRGAENV